MTNDLFDLAVALLTLRTRPDVAVSVPGITDDPVVAAADWPAFLREVAAELAGSGAESTTEAADILLVRATAAHRSFVQEHPALMDRVRSVVTVRNAVVQEIFDDHEQ